MTQLRQDYPLFVERTAEIITINPDPPDILRSYWWRYDLPFVGLVDPARPGADALRGGRAPGAHRAHADSDSHRPEGKGSLCAFRYSYR